MHSMDVLNYVCSKLSWFGFFFLLIHKYRRRNGFERRDLQCQEGENPSLFSIQGSG